MSPVLTFKLILLSLVAIIGLELVARRLRLPPAAALLVGGAAMAFVPGLPRVELDPELVLIVFLPPLLMDGAYFTVWDDFRRNLKGILLLAIGAVVFTTLVVGCVVHWIAPGLPWGACFALGAIVSPPDAIAAKAVLERVALPRRVMVLLEGESLLNDAVGLVLYRFAVAAALTGAFSFPHAMGSFTVLSLGGVVVGAIIGYAVVKLLRFLEDTYLVIVATALAAWICYAVGEALNVSGVMATVTYGMMLGWHQHDIVSAAVRIRGTAFWQVVVFLFESLVFILIGLSLRDVIGRIGGAGEALAAFVPAVAAILGAVVLSRFLWIFGVDGLEATWRRLARRDTRRPDWRAATVKSWAGMRGVVTLAVALALPASMPGRDLILVASFAVIVFTVLVQGATIGPLIELLKLDTTEARDARYLTEPQAWARLEAVQFAAVSTLAYDAGGRLAHPRLLEQYGYRARMSREHEDEAELPPEARQSHYDIVLAAVAAGRKELLRLHRGGHLHDELLVELEHDLDLQEVSALHGRGA
ncbi:Na+/H+ antiporter [Cupriavidus basilensis]|uniref:Na+/H+ antiporter n=1 Tax=Cupriavidus basilensis TaxID=68895 RepID=UPI0005B9A147|nr:Na+/H+ antiporter [Cupriavidus basilensis]